MDTLVGEVIKLVFAVATVVLVPLLAALVVKALQRLGITIDAERQAQLEKAAQDAILAAEEIAHAKVVAGVNKLLPAEKLQAALTHMMDQVPGITTEEATALVMQELPKVREATQDFLLLARQKVTG